MKLNLGSSYVYSEYFSRKIEVEVIGSEYSGVFEAAIGRY
ncbi:hypothetical protein J2T12_000969 [Paenibacillus anaericanus]|nr:hypothetical protein [Paenibacillus anaericanus]